MSAVDIVLIGRNEGARLERALASIQGHRGRIVYVDSGSTDDSVAAARAAGAEVVELDSSQPFTAARARNAGYNALVEGVSAEFVQFIDGDCMLEDGWLAAGEAHLRKHADTGLVTGWRSEVAPDASIYNALCDFEWHRPAGPILACGGDMMVRSKAFAAVDGFDPTVIAAEDDEFCTRLRKAGWHLERLPQEMTVHDANMHSFAAWWRRAVRSGHGFAQVGHLHSDYFGKERCRVLLYGAVLPLLALTGLLLSGWLVVAALAVYGVSYMRTAQGLIREGLERPDALRHAILLSLSKFPNLIGMGIFHWRNWRQAKMTLIEYK